MPKTPAAREPFLWAALFALALYTLDLYHQHAQAREIALDLRDRTRWHMEPLIQRYPRAPQVTWFAGIPCESDCGTERAGWRWATKKGVDYQGDCYGENSAYTLGIVAGCESYIEVMHFPKMRDDI